MGFEKDGLTTIVFRKKLKESANAAIKAGDAKEPPVARITPCLGEWASPRGCDLSKGQCDYHARWEYYSRRDEIKFTITTSNTNHWTGIGFDDDQKMSQTDAVLGWVDKSGRHFLMDTWIRGYTSPLLDTSQDIYNKTGKIENGMTILSFVRKRSTPDQSDMSFTDEKCLYLMFTVKGGIFNSVNKKIRKHEIIPRVTAQRVCIRTCGEGEELPTSTEPPRIGYNVAVKLVQLGQNFQAPAPGSTDFDLLANTISDGFNRALNKIPGFYKMSVKEFQQEKDNVIAKMELELDEGKLERGRSLEDSHESVVQVLNETVINGKVGALTLDPQYLRVEPLQVTTNLIDEDAAESKSLLLSATKLWIVIGCIIALVTVAVIQAGCTIYRTMRSPSPNNKRVYAIPVGGPYPAPSYPHHSHSRASWTQTQRPW